MNKEPNIGHGPISMTNNARRHRLEALFLMAHEQVQEKPIGRFNRNEIYEERIESIYRGSDQ